MTTTLAPLFERPQVSVRDRAVVRHVLESATWQLVGRLAALSVLLVGQSLLSVHLIYANTAFADEATYLGAGHQLLYAWLHGGPNMLYPTYFSGAPVIYPVIGALVDSVGGLVAARFLSLGFMLIATCALYASGRRLAGFGAGWFAAAAFVTLQGTQFLGAFATYDAMALMLVAVATWIVIRHASAPDEVSMLVYLAAPVMVFANATKYASAIFDPAIVAIALFAVANRHGYRAGIRVAGILASITVALLAALLALAGSEYWAGITSTTTNRAASDTSVSTIIHVTVSWIGAVVLLAAIATVTLVVLAARRRVSWASALLGVTLLGTTLLAPANQARIRTLTSLSKHVNFGAWFGSLLAGYLLAAIAGRGFRQGWRIAPALAILAPMLVAGAHQARHEFLSWYNSSGLVERLKPLVYHSTKPILVEDSAVPTYYFGDAISPTRWVSTYYYRYQVAPGAPVLSGAPAYVAAVKHDAFAVIALDWGDTYKVDDAVSKAIGENHDYHYVGTFQSHHTILRSAYVIWRLGPATKK